MRGKHPPLDRASIHNILVRSTNWIGDAVMTTPAIAAIRETFPAARITLLANPLTCELFSPHPHLDGVIIYDRKGAHSGLSGRLRLAAELKQRGFDLAILLQNAFDAALITWLARIPRRMGYKTDGRALFLTHGCPVDRGVRELHQVEYYLRMLDHFGVKASSRRLFLATGKEEDEAIAALLKSCGISDGDFLLGINPGASYGSAKRWRPDRFAAVADELASRFGAKVVITGGPGETGIAGEIEAAMKGRCLNLAGKTSVRSLMALIKRCNFFVTNDSGPMHIAAAFNIPLVAIFGPTDHRTTAPYSEKSVVVRKEEACAPCLKRECPTDHRCMAAVTVDDVVAAALKLATG